MFRRGEGIPDCSSMQS